MKGIYKRIIEAFLVVALAVVGFVTIAQPAFAAEGDVARIAIAGGNSWEVNYWNSGAEGHTAGVTAVEALVETYGEYTISVDFSGVYIENSETSEVIADGALNGPLQFLGIEIVNGETNIPNSFVHVTSLTIDDGDAETDPVEVAVGTTYTNEEGAGSGLTRLNLYNQWAAVAEGDRTLYGSSQVTAQAVDPTLFVGAVSISITFEVVEGVPYNTPVAYLNYASSGWSVNHWMDGNDYSPVVAVTEVVEDFDEQYTVSLDFSGVEGGAALGIEFTDIEILNGELLFPGSFMQIDEVLINGTAVTLASDTYTSSDNEIDTRTNLYNAWVTGFIGTGRTIDATYDNISATPLTSDMFASVTSISVTFTLKQGMDIGSTPLPEGGTVGYLEFGDAAWGVQYWRDSTDTSNDTAGIVATDAVITGYGQYTTSLDLSGAVDGEAAALVATGFGFLDVEILGGENYFPYNYIQIDEVLINGSAVTLTADPYTLSENASESSSYLYNGWAGPIDDTCRLAADSDAESSSATPLDISAYADVAITSISVTFTIIKGVLPEPVDDTYVVPEEFKAFLMFASLDRNWERFDAGLDTVGDTMITGDGTWTVYLDSTIGYRGGAVLGNANEGEVFLIDIVDFGTAMEYEGTMEDQVITATGFSVTVQVWVDDVLVSSNNSNILSGDIENNGRLRIELMNLYGTGTADAPVVEAALLNPTASIRVEFTLSGTGVNADNAPETHNVTFDPDNLNPDTVVVVEDGQAVAEPADPVKEGHTFVEWQLNGAAYDFSTPVTADITLIAVYEVVETGCGTGCNSELAFGQVAAVVGVILTTLGGLAFFLLKKKF